MGKIGNVFSPPQIDNCVVLGDSLQNIAISQYTLKCVGIDFGFGSSKTAVVMCEHLKEEDKIIVRFAEQYEKSNPQAIVDLCHSIHRNNLNTFFFVDGANRGAVNLLKVAFGESLTWEPGDVSPDTMKILPINFQTEHKQMLSHLHFLITKNYLAIPSKYNELIISLRTAYANELLLNKDQTSYNDLLDGLCLALKGYQLEYSKIDKP